MAKLPFLYEKLKTLADKEMGGRRRVRKAEFLSTLSSKFRLDKKEIRQTLKEMNEIIYMKKRHIGRK